MEQIEKYVEDIYNNMIFTFKYIYLDISIHVIAYTSYGRKKPQENV